MFPRIQPFGSSKLSSLGKVYSRHATDSLKCENSFPALLDPDLQPGAGSTSAPPCSRPLCVCSQKLSASCFSVVFWLLALARLCHLPCSALPKRAPLLRGPLLLNEGRFRHRPSSQVLPFGSATGALASLAAALLWLLQLPCSRSQPNQRSLLALLLCPRRTGAPISLHPPLAQQARPSLTPLRLDGVVGTGAAVTCANRPSAPRGKRSSPKRADLPWWLLRRLLLLSCAHALVDSVILCGLTDSDELSTAMSCRFAVDTWTIMQLDAHLAEQEPRVSDVELEQPSLDDPREPRGLQAAARVDVPER